MSCFGGGSKSPEEQEAASRSKQIDAALKEESRAQKNKFKLLLLGTGDAGKSTFAKQMKVIHKDGFSKAEIERFTDILRDNCLVAMQKLLQAAQEWEFKIGSKLKDKVEAVINATQLTSDLAETIQNLWKADFVQKAFERNNEIQLPGGASGAEYFFEHALRFAADDYLPTQEDVIRAKVRTTGITETVFQVQNSEFTMVDVGGQRSERRKWLNCFNSVSAVLFLAAMNEYDMVLEENNETNRMEESLQLFIKLSDANWFKGVPFILFLNKSDLFDTKIQKRPLVDFFEDYEEFAASRPSSEDEIAKSREYIKKQYTENIRDHRDRRLYAFFTCAIDTGTCKKVFDAVRDAIINLSLDQDGV